MECIHCKGATDNVNSVCDTCLITGSTGPIGSTGSTEFIGPQNAPAPLTHTMDTAAASHDQSTELNGPTGGTESASVDMCIPGCTYKPTDARMNIVKCLWCRRSHHKKCINTEAYVCDTCRVMQYQIAQMSSTVIKLSNTIDRVLEINLDLQDTVKRQEEKIELLSKSVQSISNTAPRLSPNLLIGSSVIRDISADKLINTKVMSISGGRITDVSARLQSETDTYHRVTLMVGGNDCSARTDQKPIEAIIDDFRAMIECAKTKAEHVYVGSVLPREAGMARVTERIDALNIALIDMCKDLDVILINNDTFFKFPDRSINDGYYIKDLTHLNSSGANRLAKSLQLPVKDEHTHDVTRSYATAARRAKSSSKNTPSDPKHNSSKQGAGGSAKANPSRGGSKPSHSAKSSPPHGHVQDHVPRRDDARQGGSPRRPDRPRDNSPVDNGRGDRDSNGWSQVRPRSNYGRGNQRGGEDRWNTHACEYCNEPNHRKDSCHHGRPVQCNTCHEDGHKSKHHEHNYK